ncbi:MAG: DUF2382 domain-containing protein [Cyanobacteria bacterium P01_A01_bin.116]
MTLISLKDTYPNYRETFNDSSIGHLEDYSVYADGDDKVGSVEDGLFESETGQFRYLIVDTGIWIFGKKILLPIGRARFDNDDRRVYVEGLTKEQVENLPEYNGDRTVDYDYEESVRGIYRENAVSQSAPVNGAAAYTQETYSYDNDADLYDFPQKEERNQPIRLYEERLVADKNRVKTGDVVVSKRVETETASVSVPLEKERVVIERTTPTAATATASHDFNDGEVARVEVYEDRANVHTESVLREEVNVRKESEQDMVSKEATIRREELDVTADDDTTVVNR